MKKGQHFLLGIVLLFVMQIFCCENSYADENITNPNPNPNSGPNPQFRPTLWSASFGTLLSSSLVSAPNIPLTLFGPTVRYQLSEGIPQVREIREGISLETSLLFGSTTAHYSNGNIQNSSFLLRFGAPFLMYQSSWWLVSDAFSLIPEIIYAYTEYVVTMKPSGVMGGEGVSQLGLGGSAHYSVVSTQWIDQIPFEFKTKLKYWGVGVRMGMHLYNSASGLEGQLAFSGGLECIIGIE